nr:4-coumarate--CoA ligase-like isoform X1 [Onthophagus taurus]
MMQVQRVILKIRRTSRVIYRLCYNASDNCMRSDFENIVVPDDVNFVEYSWRNFKYFPNRIATECAQTGRKYTFDDLRKKSENLAFTLQNNLKLQRGDTVALLLPNVPEYPICIYGMILSGLRMTTINPTYTAEEIARQLEDSESKVIITLNDYYKTCIQAIDLIKKRLDVFIIKTSNGESIPDKTIDFHDFINCKNEFKEPNLKNEDVVFLPYSSGTTGLPKGVMITAKNLMSVMSQVDTNDVRFYVPTTETHQDVIPQILPMFHIYGYAICTISTLQSGVKLVTIPKFASEFYLECLDKHKPTILGLVPPLVLFLHSHPAVKPKHFDKLRIITSGAAPLGKSDEDKFREKVGKPVNIMQGYGLTETSGLALSTPSSKEGKYPGTMGHPIPNCTVKVVNPEDKTLKHLNPNEVGELLIKGPQVMKSYHKRPEENKNSFVNGWFRTGDLVRYDENKMFYIVDRIKELIKVKGLQVAPAELEEVIRGFPDVAEAGVIGIPHKFSGEVPRAYVVPKVGRKINLIELEEYVRKKVAPHKKLAGGIAVIDSIPKTASGKILKKQLVLRYQKEQK